MIASPTALSLLLLFLVIGLLELDKRKVCPRVFHYLPAAFWCYFVPMLLATFNLLPEKSPVYDFMTSYVLSACLILLLLDIRLPAILRLGPTALGTMAVGAVGIGVGAVGAYALFARSLPPETWKGVGALSASWIGGSANMLAVKEGLQTPDSVFAPMVIVDTVITYTWMGFLVALGPWQDRWDRWVGADRRTMEDVVQRLGAMSHAQKAPASGRSAWHAVWLIALGMFAGGLCLRLGALLPKTNWLSASGWAFILVTILGIALSFTPASRLERYGASRWGYFCLYLLLAAIGSKARLQYIFEAPRLILMAYTWVIIHGLILTGYGYLRKIPLFFLVTSSQANIGGTASTPIVAGVYQPRLASLGLLLAISGNVIGTYTGILIAQACRWVQ